MENEKFLDELFKEFDSNMTSEVDFDTLKNIAEDYNKFFSENETESVLDAIKSELNKEKYGDLEEE